MSKANSKPYYSLSDVQQLVSEGNRYIAGSATTDGSYIGFGKDEIYETILSLNENDFYKSMQSEKNHLLWQDVYKYYHESRSLLLYIKLQIKKKAVVVSFKESGEIA